MGEVNGMDLAIGDVVTRISYQHDLLFRVSSFTNHKVILHGEDMRLIADAPKDDLVKAGTREISKRKKTWQDKEDYSYRLFRQDYLLMKDKRDYESTSGYQNSPNYFQIPAKVLHVDGDKTYLKKCIDFYQRFGIQVHGVHLQEKEMPLQIASLLEKIQPDIIVITGHDAFQKNKGEKSDIRAYRHSQYFVETVREARRLYPHLDQLVIFAGACQSHFESLIRAGANFASSPSRINIHALDPVYIVAKIAFTPFMEKVGVWDALRNTLTGERGLGGIETRGLLRTGLPFVDPDEVEKDD